MQTLDGQMLLDLQTEPAPAPAIGGPYAELLESERKRRKRRRQPGRKVYTVELRDSPGAGGDSVKV